MKKNLFLTFFLNAVVLLSMCFFNVYGANIPITHNSWIVNPFEWSFSENTLKSTGSKTFAIVRDLPCASKVEMSADVVPILSDEEQWSTAGVSIYLNDKNFWHVALVRSPKNIGGRHTFEIAEMYDNVWGEGLEQSLKVEKKIYQGSWQFGEKYNLRIATDEKGIEGEIRNASGKTLFFKRLKFERAHPNIDIKAVKVGAPSLRITGNFSATFSSIKATSVGEIYKEPSKTFEPYQSNSYIPSIKRKATGFFYIDKDEDGRWWTIDPLGRGIVLTGVDHVRYEGHWSSRAKENVHYETNKKKFPKVKDWEEDTLKRLKKWGFNMLGAGCDSKLFRRGLVHTIFLKMGDILCFNTNDDATWICPNEKRPCSAFPNVFHPDFARHCEFYAEKKCKQNRNDPWLLGYFIDNELAWWGRGENSTGLFDAVMKKDEAHTAKIALRKFLKDRGVTGEASENDKIEFLRLAAELYFKHTTEAIRKYDSNHLVMGSRFAGVHGAHSVVWEVAGKYCDLVTFNIYPWADLDRNVVRVGRNLKTKRVIDAFQEVYNNVKKPILITEWSFPALDSGLPCLAGAGQRFRFQKDRTRATELFAKTMLRVPYLLGYSYFMWVDEPPEGISDAFPEDSNYGLINLYGEPYPEITSMFTKLHSNLEHWKRAAIPEERKVESNTESISAKNFMKRFPVSTQGSVVCIRKGNEYEVKNKCGFTLKGNVGGSKMFHSVFIAGKKIGFYNLMLCHIPKDRVWLQTSKVNNFSFREENGYGIIDATNEYLYDDYGFSIEHEMIVFPNSPRMVCNVKRIVNIGKKVLNLDSFYFRQHANFEITKEKIKQVPNLWKAPMKAVWMSADNTFYWGGLTYSTSSNLFYYYLNKQGGQHPDASFQIVNNDEPIPLKPNESYDPKGQFWMLAIGGNDGMTGWNKNVMTTQD
jgi:hypothetical protein